MMRVLSPEAVKRAMVLAGTSYRPKQITELKERLDGEMRAAALHLSIMGWISQDRIDEIVAMKLELDGLYGAWAEGEIE